MSRTSSTTKQSVSKIDCKKRFGLFYLAHDGITSHYAGIGTYTKSYLDNLPQIINLLENNGLLVDLYLVTPKYKKGFYGYNDSLKKSSLKLVKRYTGRLIEVDNGMKGLDSYGGIENWNMCSENASVCISKYLSSHDRNIIIAVDTPFLKVGELLNKSNSVRNYNVVLSPQSTEKIHNSNILCRYEWEKRAFVNANNSNNIFVSYSSLYIKNHLLTEYGVFSEKMVPSMSGLSLGSSRYKKYSQKYIAEQLDKYGIPLDRPLIFTLGRLEPYKGFLETIKLFKQIDAKFKPYLVMLGFSYTKDNPMISKLKEIKNKEKIDGKFIFQLDLILPTLIWQWKNTKISAHISQFEPFGLAPVEARLLAKNHGPVVVVSDRGGLPEQIINGKDGFIAKYDSTDSYSDVVNKIFSLSPEELRNMRTEAYKRVIEKYDSKKNILKLLTCVDSDIKHLCIKKQGSIKHFLV